MRRLLLAIVILASLGFQPSIPTDAATLPRGSLNLADQAEQAPTRTPAPNARSLEVGPSAQYQTITAALSGASSGDTILVHGGVYTEMPDVKTSAVSIQAAGDGSVWIDAQCSQAHAIVISADELAIG